MSTHFSQALKLYGTDAPVTPLRTLRAGPLSCVLDAGNLRYIRINGAEALRAVSFVVRDSVWGTYNPAISDLAVDESADRFVVSYTALVSDDAQSLGYRARIEADASGDLRFCAEVEPVTDFETRRVGFVVLHPLVGVVGRDVDVLHVDGSTETSVFPELVEPWQPFMDIRALTHEVSPGLRITCHMEGDIYEMEDHRNWTDASFKTYIRPLGKPAPFIMPAGESSSQAVILSLDGQPKAAGASAGPEPAVELTLGEQLDTEPGSMPRIGIGLHPRRLEAALGVAADLESLGAQVLVCHYDPRDGHDARVLRQFGELARQIGAEPALEAIVPCEPDYRSEINAMAAAIAESGTRFEAIAVAPGPDLIASQPFSDWPAVPPLADLYAAVRAAIPSVPIGGGSFSFFTELNRRRPTSDSIDFLSHVTAAIVHAADDTSITETLESLPDVIATAAEIRGEKPYRLGPVGIAARHSPFGGEPTSNPHGQRLTMARIEPRQRGLLGAAYYLGYAARMAAAADVLTLCAPVGEFGLIHAPMPFAQPGFDDRGGVFPSWHVVRGLAAVAGNARIKVESSDPSSVLAWAAQTAGGRVAWIANLGSAPRQVAVNGLAGNARVAVLDEHSFERCTATADGLEQVELPMSGSTIDLGAYAIARLTVSS